MLWKYQCERGIYKTSKTVMLFLETFGEWGECHLVKPQGRLM